SSVIVVPARALLTGQLALAVSAASWNCSAEMPGTCPFTLSTMPVMPSPGWNVTSALVCSDSGGVPAPASPGDSAMEKPGEVAAMSSSGEVLPLAASALDAHETSNVPTPEVSSETVPAPSSRAPFHWVVAVRIVAMTWGSLLYGVTTISRPKRVLTGGHPALH